MNFQPIDIQIDTENPAQELPGGWTLDHISKSWSGQTASIYYTCGQYGTGEVLRVSDHWAGDPGIDSIDGLDWRLGGEANTFRAGTASMVDLEANGCYHWIAEVAPLTGTETLEELVAMDREILDTLRSEDLRINTMGFLNKLRDRSGDLFHAAVQRFGRDAAVQAFC